MPKRDIYLLSPKQLSPETIAVAFAKTSRSPESFRDIAAELSDEKSAQFHEKWVVGYGHASVAEHAVLHLAIENVSRVAIESIESNRLASYTEKSTRYQKWDADAFTIPPELEDHPLREDYVTACRLLFQTYADSLAPRPQTGGGPHAAPRERKRRSLRPPHPLAVCRFVPLPAARRCACQRRHDRQRARARERHPQDALAPAGRGPRDWRRDEGRRAG